MHTDLKAPPLGALVGAPNSGKTTLYNWLTGSKFHTVNYPGSTVEYSIGQTLEVYGESWGALDTPGIYSLVPKSPEEQVTVKALYESPSPQIVVAVVDATQLSRHLLLVRQLVDSGFRVVVALTMMDLLQKRGVQLDLTKLSQALGLPIVPVDGRLGGGVKDLVRVMSQELKKEEKKTLGRPEAWSPEQIETLQREMVKLSESVVSPGSKAKLYRIDATTARMDSVLLHPLWGVLLFVLIMGALFSSIYWVAAPFMDFVDGGFSAAADFVEELGPGTLWANFLSRGVVAGLGAVLVFVPQIFILFLGMILLEDWGYLARAATIIDRPLSKIGLNGRSFVPILSGYACAIPAMMAARTISSRRERLLTLFIIPLMSCSARLPVYALLLAYLFQGRPAWQPGLALLGLYVLSLVTGVVAAAIAGRIMKEKETSWFMLELPVYRRPVPSHVLWGAARRTWSYVTRAGPAILIFSLIIWAGTTFPHYNIEDEGQRLASSYAAGVGKVIEPVMEPMGADWRVGVGLIAAFAAREVFVSALALIFNVTDTDEDSMQASLLNSMSDAVNAEGAPLFTPATVLGLILFFMISLQCLSTVVVSKKESGSWKFAALQVFVFTTAAYIVAVAVVQISRILF